MAKSASSRTRSDVWALTHGVRASLAADLENLTAEQWWATTCSTDQSPQRDGAASAVHSV